MNNNQKNSNQKKRKKSAKICIIGGCGHVGIPLGLALASKNFNVTLIDINKQVVDTINSCKLPFIENGAEELLKKHMGKNLIATTDANMVKQHDVVIFVTGTPVDEYHNPKINYVLNVIKAYLPLMNKNQLVILRSTIYPGTTEIIDNILKKEFGTSKLAFCPERIVQGDGIKEIFNLPQLISATSDEARIQATEIFSEITSKTIDLEPKEAELAKLMTNTWRYIEFAIANQFYIMTESAGLDFYKILDAMKDNYPRAKNFAYPGLTAGPCLFKDTMQLNAFCRQHFGLEQAAAFINEGLPKFLVSQLEKKMGSLKDKKIAILGMTFKADNDDIRESLSFKVKKELEFKMSEVIISDVYLKDTLDYKQAVKSADGVILGVPHREYRNLTIDKPFIDCWNVWK